jgi:hypothetical protein
MKTIQIKYDNFRKFLAEAMPPGSFWLSLIASVPLDTFLHSIYKRVVAELGLTLQQITDKVLLQARLQKSDFTTMYIDKFSLYCEYFLQIVQQVYKK